MSTSTTSARQTPALPITEQPVPETRRQQGTGPAESLALAAALGVCLVARLPHRLAEGIGVRGWTLALVVAVAVVSVARAAARAPFTLRQSRNDNQPTSRWATKEAALLGGTFAVGTAVALPLYALFRATPTWWLPAALATAAVTVIWQIILPRTFQARLGTLVAAPEPLGGRLSALAVAAGVDLPSGVVVATKAADRGANAYVVGLGPTRRVVLERAVAAWPPELVEQAVAHELGHVRLGHVGRRLPLALLAQLSTLAGAAAVLSFSPLLHAAGVDRLGDPASYPLLLAVGALVVFPVRCLLAWHSRAQERAADRFALALLGRPDVFTAMLARAAADSGAPAQLAWWRRLTASHPPVDERAAAATRTSSPHPDRATLIPRGGSQPLPTGA